jgi:PAS domain S-box-containing protein
MGHKAKLHNVRNPNLLLLVVATGGLLVGGFSVSGLLAAALVWVAMLIVWLIAAAMAKISREGLLLCLRGLAMPRSSALMKMLVENSCDAILTVGENGDIHTINAAAESMFGYASGEIIGRNLSMLLPAISVAADHGVALEAPAMAPKLFETGNGRIAAVNRHGARKTLDIATSQMKIGQQTSLILIARDATKRAEVEETLLQAKEAAELSSRSKTEFLHNMSHELRTPLNAIIGFSEVMQRETFGPMAEKYLDYAQDIQASGRHLLSVINDILDVAKIESGHFELTEERVSIADILNSTFRLVRHRAIRAGVALLAPVAESLPIVRADGRVLKQVILNLLDNATKFTAAGGHVVVTATETTTGSVEITVADDGIGIPADRLDSVMQPFAQVGDSLNRKYGGTGLGLPLAKRFIEMHGGNLILRSELGVGTTAIVRLPPERVFPAGLQDDRIAS